MDPEDDHPDPGRDRGDPNQMEIDENEELEEPPPAVPTPRYVPPHRRIQDTDRAFENISRPVPDGRLERTPRTHARFEDREAQEDNLAQNDGRRKEPLLPLLRERYPDKAPFDAYPLATLQHMLQLADAQEGISPRVPPYLLSRFHNLRSEELYALAK